MPGQSLAQGVIVEEIPTGTHTQYQVSYPTGAITCDVHEMITRFVNDTHSQISSIRLVIPDDDQPPTWIQVDDVSKFDFEICLASNEEVLVEQVCYTGHDRSHTSEHHVMVHGWAEPPSVPDLPAGEA